MKCPNTSCKSKKVKYKYSFIEEHVYECKKCGKKIIIERKKIEN